VKERNYEEKEKEIALESYHKMRTGIVKDMEKEMKDTPNMYEHDSGHPAAHKDLVSKKWYSLKDLA
jgi:hypothetical protein